MANFGIFKGFSDKLFEGELATQLGLIGTTSVYDLDSIAFFDRVTVAGGTLLETEKSAINQLVLNLKSYSLWSKMKAIYPMVGASAAACSQNLKSSSFTGTFTSGWTFSNLGVNGNGISAYMNTNFNGSTQLVFTDIHMAIYKNLGTISSSTKSNGVYNISSTNAFALSPDSNTTNYSVGEIGSYSPSTIVQNDPNLQGNGFYIVARNANNFIKLTKNNTNTITNTTTSSPASVPNDNIWLGATHAAGSTSVVNANNYRYAFLSFGNYLDTTEASNFYTAVQAFQTTLSRQV